MSLGMTLTKFVLQEQRNHPDASGNFTDLLADLARAAKLMSREVNKAGLINILGTAGYANVQGEEVQKLDEYTNSVILNAMEHGGHLAAMASEEMDEIYEVPEEYPRGNYLMTFDPLDGSSNIDVNISIGTIFSILRKREDSRAATAEDFFQSGSEQVCAGYFLYGSSTMLIYTTGNGVHGFTLDQSIGSFILSHENIKTPARGSIYSINEGNARHWYPGTASYIDMLKTRGEKKKVTARYIGSLVADFHRNLMKGGVFLYPRDKKAESGKLRLLYEANPLAFIAEQAGGAATTGETRILDIVPDELHQRVPLIIGSREDVAEAEKCWQEAIPQ
ncbi:MAG: class 1 fructose-bisphosphatase [Deltaproteobacteria bacterium]|nr:class 1 fructose-bisphosphatase [Deltaproteobacteria bacterium]